LGIACSFELKLTQRRFPESPRRPSANANPKTAEYETAGQISAGEKSQRRRRHIQGTFATRA
jgi:hypothetical protein